MQLNSQSVTPGTYGPCVSQVVNSRGVITSIATVPCPSGGGGGIGGSGSVNALAKFLTPTTLGDSLLSESSNRLIQQNGSSPQSFLFAGNFADSANWNGLLVDTNWEGIGWIGLFATKAGNGQAQKLALGTLGAQEVLIYANGSISAKFHMNSSVDFNGTVFVPDLVIGIRNGGAQHKQTFHSAFSPFSTHLQAGAATEEVVYKLPLRKPLPNEVLSGEIQADGSVQLVWRTP